MRQSYLGNFLKNKKIEASCVEIGDIITENGCEIIPLVFVYPILRFLSGGFRLRLLSLEAKKKVKCLESLVNYVPFPCTFRHL